MEKRVKIHKTSFWDKRDNLVNKPSLSYRTIEVIQHIMEMENLNLGVAIEKLIQTSPYFEEVLEDLSQDYPDIKTT